jgi:hypothetical protein
MRWKFREDRPETVRRAEAEKIMARHPDKVGISRTNKYYLSKLTIIISDKVPVILEALPTARLGPLEKKKYLVLGLYSLGLYSQ